MTGSSAGNGDPGASRFVAVALVFEGALLVVAVGLGALLETHPLRAVSLGFAGIGGGIVATVPLVIGLWASVRAGWDALDRLTDQIVALLGPLLARGSVAGFAAISLLAGVAEEALFRGVLQAALMDVLGPMPAILTAAALFGAAHAVTPLYAVLAALVGVYLGLVFHVSGNLAVPMLAHALYDFVALLWLARLARHRLDARAPGQADGDEHPSRVEPDQL